MQFLFQHGVYAVGPSAGVMLCPSAGFMLVSLSRCYPVSIRQLKSVLSGLDILRQREKEKRYFLGKRVFFVRLTVYRKKRHLIIDKSLFNSSVFVCSSILSVIKCFFWKEFILFLTQSTPTSNSKDRSRTMRKRRTI